MLCERSIRRLEILCFWAWDAILGTKLHNCVLSLEDKEVPAKTKLQMLQALIEFKEPDEFKRCKPSNVQIGETTELPELISEQSYLLFEHFNISRASIKEWHNNSLNTIDVLNHPQLLDFIVWIKNISVVNDGAERNIKLIQDFI